MPLVAAACVYVAAKAEETAIHIKVVVAEARATFNGVFSVWLTFPFALPANNVRSPTEYGNTNFPSDSTKLAEMELCQCQVETSIAADRGAD